MQQEQERRKEERGQEFRAALLEHRDDLRHREDFYRTIIENRLYEPFSDAWAYCVDELQKTEYRLDILCAADCEAYPRMKAYHGDFPTDFFQWLLDCLAVLQEDGAFQAAEEEIKEIKAKANFEVRQKMGRKEVRS